MIALAVWGWIWALPLHLIALVLLPFYGPSSVTARGGKLEIRVARAIGNPGGQTYGQITFYTREPWDALRTHENTHTLQCWIFGPTFIILYPLASLIAVLAGQDFHDGNIFEVWAWKVSGVM